ncbi:hypothetical protein KIN34_14380 [Cellulomonas sp. DKR-3]|uniref:SMODS and SLOG-associating 2TM effector domain-containing protein n=1 Tax=Cellulomonas fulva TaxID=2835530 RepID=A0ABS5U259_9CELL|nr:hypothetical protein [Cellulomonas fulva]MBT0995470.1 hypothetical protein [Cellulomonas fulva]
MDQSDIVAAVSAALSLAAILISSLFARQQIVQARRDQLFPVMTHLLGEFRSTEFKANLYAVEHDLANGATVDSEGRPQLRDAERARAVQVMSFFNYIGALVANGSVSLTLVSSLMGGSIENAWRATGPYIYADRERRNGDDVYYAYFEHLAAEISNIGPTKLHARLVARGRFRGMRRLSLERGDGAKGLKRLPPGTW